MDLYGTPGHLIRRLQQMSTQVFQRRVQEAGFQLTPVQFAALRAIRAQPGLDQAQVAALIAYDRATIGGVIDRLERKGLINRVVNRRDRRSRVVSLSEEGQQILDKLLPIVTSLQGEILGKLDAGERKTFTALLSKATGE